MTRLAVIVTTYNWPAALEKVLCALLRQTVHIDEIWIADDGSMPETANVIERVAQTAGRIIYHVWHEDKGFRAAAIRNRALRHVTSEYVVFIDGDCVPFPDFIQQHRNLAEAGYCVVGHRLLLTSEVTPLWLANEALWPKSWLDWFKAYRKSVVNRLAPLCRLPTKGLFSAWRCWGRQGWEGAKTCNLAFWVNDLQNVNGFDESYSGWGLEDSDLMIRVLRNRVRRKSGRFATGVVHLWHQENDRSTLHENSLKLKALQRGQGVRSLLGLNEIEENDHRVTRYE